MTDFFAKIRQWYTPQLRVLPARDGAEAYGFEAEVTHQHAGLRARCPAPRGPERHRRPGRLRREAVRQGGRAPVVPDPVRERPDRHRAGEPDRHHRGTRPRRRRAVVPPGEHPARRHPDRPARRQGVLHHRARPPVHQADPRPGDGRRRRREPPGRLDHLGPRPRHRRARRRPAVRAPAARAAIASTHRARSAYQIQAFPSSETGSRIDAAATITFDIRPPLETRPIFNTLDMAAPTTDLTVVQPDPGVPIYQLSWTAQDETNGSGVQDTTIYVSEDGGPFTAWLSQTTETAAVYVGQAGKTYRFAAQSRDHVGNVEFLAELFATGTGGGTQSQISHRPRSRPRGRRNPGHRTCFDGPGVAAAPVRLRQPRLQCPDLRVRLRGLRRRNRPAGDRVPARRRRADQQRCCPQQPVPR